ncbi:MAG: CinA family protein [Chromatiales bacterium]|nr:CinA family protein [Chromatiales bacterium]
MSDLLNLLVSFAGERLVARGWKLAVAESCTGGWIGKAITDVSGSSAWFERGFVVYSNQAKVDLLGVKPATLEAYGAVSEPTAREMADGALARSRAQLAVAVTGIAGPDGGSREKPVGTVFLAWAARDEETRVQRMRFLGDRAEVRLQSVQSALQGVVDLLS